MKKILKKFFKGFVVITLIAWVSGVALRAVGVDTIAIGEKFQAPDYNERICEEHNMKRVDCNPEAHKTYLTHLFDFHSSKEILDFVEWNYNCGNETCMEIHKQ